MIEQSPKTEKQRFAIIAPFIIFAGLMLAFYGSWNSHYAGDDHGTFKNIQRARALSPDGEIKLLNLLIATSSVKKTHWNPLLSLIRPFLNSCDTIKRSVITSLVSLFLLAFMTGWIAIEFGTGLLPAMFASGWIATSESLVYSLNTAWGPSFFILSIFILLSFWILARWSYKLIFTDILNAGHWRLIVIFSLVFVVSLLTNERSLRVAILGGGTCFMIALFRHDLKYWKAMTIMLLLIILSITIYIAVRFYWTETVVPFIRTYSQTAQSTYKMMRLSPLTVIKNASFLLFGNLNPVNSYTIYRNIYMGLTYKSAVLIIPGLAWGIILMIGAIKTFLSESKQNRFAIALITLSIIASLIPEVFLGEVSEAYLVQSLWPLALLLAISMKQFSNNRVLKNIIIICAVMYIGTNIASSRDKVTEINAASLSAYRFRGQLMELLKKTPPKSEVLLLYQPRPRSAFGRFGTRGFDANGGAGLLGEYRDRNRITKVQWSACISNPDEYAMIIEESSDRSKLNMLNNWDIIKYQKQFCEKTDYAPL